MGGVIEGTSHILARFEWQPLPGLPQLERQGVAPQLQQAGRQLERQRSARVQLVSS